MRNNIPAKQPKKKQSKDGNEEADTEEKQPADKTQLISEAFRRGTQLLHQGRAKESVPFLEQAYEIQPESIDVAINLGGAYIMTKKFSKAVSVLEPASRERSDQSQLWINLGAAYLGNPILATGEDQEKAISAFEHALVIDPSAPSVAYNIGLVYRDRGDTEQAIHWFRQAVKHNPTDQDARSLLNKLGTDEKNDSDPPI